MRRTAPRPVQNDVVGPGLVWCTWWCSRLRKVETVVGTEGESSYEPNTAVVAGSDERDSDPLERVGVHLDVGVDEHEHLVAGPGGAGVARLDRGELPGTVDDDHLVVGAARRTDGRQAPLQGGGTGSSPESPPRAGASAETIR